MSKHELTGALLYTKNIQNDLRFPWIKNTLCLRLRERQDLGGQHGQL